VTARRLAVAAIAVAALVPPDRLASAPTLCLFRRITGRPCPSCGLTRSWNAMGHGQLRTALLHHPFGPLTFLAAVVIALRGPRAIDQLVRRDRRVAAGLGTLWLGAWLGRFLREPFSGGRACSR
jgi:hypothetical protein